MSLKKISQTRAHFALILGLLLIIALCLLHIYHTYHQVILPEQIAKNTYQRTVCFIVNKKLSNKGLVIHYYRADFLVSYSVDGVLYKRWVSGNGLDTTYSKNEAAQEDLLSQYDVGGTYRCWYDPATPMNVILVFRSNWFSLFYLIGIPIAISILCLYFIISTLIRSKTSRGTNTKSEQRRRKNK